MNTNLGTLTLDEFKESFQLWQKIKNNSKLQWLRSYKRIPQSPDPIVQYEELDIFLKNLRTKIVVFEIFFILLMWAVAILCVMVCVGWGNLFKGAVSLPKIIGILSGALVITGILFVFFIWWRRLVEMLLDSHLSRIWTTREFFSDVKMLAQTCGDGPGNPEVLEARNEMTTDIAPEHVFKIVRAHLITEAGIILSNFSPQGNPDIHELCKRCLKETFETFKRFRIFKTNVDIEFAYDAARAAAKLAKDAVQQ